MQIELYYCDRTGGQALNMYTVRPVETIKIFKQENTYGAPKITKSSELTNTLRIPGDGLVVLELTKTNAEFIQAGVENKQFQYVSEDNAVFVEQLLAKQDKNAEAEDIAFEDIPTPKRKRASRAKSGSNSGKAPVDPAVVVEI